MIHITNTVAFDEHAIKERFIRAVGPRGVNVDKDATGVELRFDISHSSLPEDVKERLIAIGGRRVTTDGVLVVLCRADRSQVQNRSAAHAQLFALLERAATSPAIRRPTHIAPATERKRLVAKKQHSAVKRSRRTPSSDS